MSIYDAHFGLTQRPFLMAPDPQFIYWSKAHSLAFTMLRYSVMTVAPITVITGEIGAGKTTLLRQLLTEMPGDRHVGLVSNIQAGRGELLHWILMALDEPFQDEPYVQLFKRFQDRVISSYGEGRRVVLIFDEAQNMAPETLEELRTLSNINSDQDDLLQIVLIGQPQLRDLLQRPDLVQFAQRISADFHLTCLNEEEVAAYIHHRLTLAGATWQIFSDDACRLIHQATRGVPRLVNILCDLCLVYAFSEDSDIVRPDAITGLLEGMTKHQMFSQLTRNVTVESAGDRSVGRQTNVTAFQRNA